jgi:hypothetical protein
LVFFLSRSFSLSFCSELLCLSSGTRFYGGIFTYSHDIFIYSLFTGHFFAPYSHGTCSKANHDKTRSVQSSRKAWQRALQQWPPGRANGCHQTRYKPQPLQWFSSPVRGGGAKSILARSGQFSSQIHRSHAGAGGAADTGSWMGGRPMCRHASRHIMASVALSSSLWGWQRTRRILGTHPRTPAS